MPLPLRVLERIGAPVRRGAEVEAMLRDGTIRDATTVAAFGLLRLQGRL